MRKLLFTLILLVSGFTQAQTFDFSCNTETENNLQTLSSYWDSLWAQSEGWTTSDILREGNHGFNFWQATDGTVDVRIAYNYIINDSFEQYVVPAGSQYLVVTGSETTITPRSSQLDTVEEIKSWMDDVYGAYSYVAPVIDLGIPTEWTEINSDHDDYDLAWENCNGDKIFSDLINWVYQLNGETAYSEVFSSMEALLETGDIDCGIEGVSFTTSKDGTISNDQNNMDILPNDGSTNRTATVTYRVVDRNGENVDIFNGSTRAQAMAFVSGYVTIPSFFTIDHDDEVFYHRAIDGVTPGFLFDGVEPQNIAGDIKKGGLVHDGITNDAGGVISNFDGAVTIEEAFNFILALDGIDVYFTADHWYYDNHTSMDIYEIYDFVAEDFLSDPVTEEVIENVNFVEHEESGLPVITAEDYAITFHGQSTEYQGIPTSIVISAGGVTLNFSLREVGAYSLGRYNFDLDPHDEFDLFTISYAGSVHRGSDVIPAGHSVDSEGNTPVKTFYDNLVIDFGG